jgi:hypothetical protein
VGSAVYFLVSWLLKSRELAYFINLAKRMLVARKVAPLPAKEEEPIAPLDNI